MTPYEHYAAAERLMAKVAEMDNPTLPIARAMTAQAAVYAALAQRTEIHGEQTVRIERN